MERTFDIEELLDHSGWLRALAARLVSDPGAADDLVQETWIAALRRPPRADDSPRPWLARVARNLARNVRRDARTRAEREQDAHAERRPPTPESIALEVEAQRLVAEGVGALAEPGRTIVVLRYFRGLDSAQIGCELSLPAGTVRWRLKQALEELRAELDCRGGGREAWGGLLVRVLRAGTPGAGVAAASSATWLVTSLVAGTALVALVAWLAAPDRDGDMPLRVAAAPATLDAVVGEPANALDPAVEAPRVAVGLPPRPAPAEEAAISGRVWLDGRVPQRRMRVELQEDVADAPARFVATDADGTFALRGLPVGWRGSVRVRGYATEDGEESVDVSAPESGVELRLRDGPALTGHFLLPGTGAPIPLPPGTLEWNVECRLYFQRGSTGVLMLSERTDDEGYLRIALAPEEEPPPEALDDVEPERMRAEILAEVPGLARLVVRVPEFMRAEGYDLGDVVLAPAGSASFRVLDDAGVPLAGATAWPMDWGANPVETDAQGDGTLPCVPMEGARVRFGAPRFRDQDLVMHPGETPVVRLERSSALDLRVVRAGGDPLPEMRIHVIGPAELFGPAGSTPPKTSGGRGRSGSGWAESAGKRYYFTRFAADSSGELLLQDLPSGLRFTVEVHATDGRLLGARECAVADGEWQELELPISD